MKKVCLDYINERYYLYKDGTIWDEIMQEYKTPYLTKGKPHVNLFNLSKDAWSNYTVASLIADNFVPNPFSFKFIGYRDGDPKNVSADNIAWIASKNDLNKSKLTSAERKKLRIKIHDAVESGDWYTAQKLGNELDRMVGENVRHMPNKFTPVNIETNIPAQYSPIIEVCDTHGNHITYGSVKQLTQMFNFNPVTVLNRCYSDATFRDELVMNIVALVPKNLVNATIGVYKGTLKIAEGHYISICLQYDIHFEDLYDLLYTNDNDTILYNGLEFKMNPDQKKVPIDYSKGVI